MTTKKRIAVLGAGQIGVIIAGMLAEPGHQVTLADASAAQLKNAAGSRFATETVDASNLDALRVFLKDRDIVVSACPYFLNKGIAKVAAETKTHYFDLTEDVATTSYIKELGETSDVALVPQCGLAPGFICILGADMAARFETVSTIKMRVGALPLYPTNALRYNVTWSVDGLINEYCNPCEIVFDGKPTLVPALEGIEGVMIDGVAYEAFNTSGGLGSMCETYAGRVRHLDYRSIRYPGHAAIMKALLHDLRLRERRDVLKDILERAVPATAQDVVVIFVTVSGLKDGRLVQETYANKIYAREVGGRVVSAIQATTAAGVATALDLLAQGKLPQSGLVRQEDIPLNLFLANRFGQVYARDAERMAAA